MHPAAPKRALQKTTTHRDKVSFLQHLYYRRESKSSCPQTLGFWAHRIDPRRETLWKNDDGWWPSEEPKLPSHILQKSMRTTRWEKTPNPQDHKTRHLKKISSSFRSLCVRTIVFFIVISHQPSLQLSIPGPPRSAVASRASPQLKRQKGPLPSAHGKEKTENHLMTTPLLL